MSEGGTRIGYQIFRKRSGHEWEQVDVVPENDRGPRRGAMGAAEESLRACPAPPGAELLVVQGEKAWQFVASEIPPTPAQTVVRAA